MKRYAKVTITLIALINFQIPAFSCINSLGSLELSNSEVECIDHSGTITLIDIKIKKKYTNSGKSKFRNVSVETILTSGAFTADNLTANEFKGSGSFYGDRINIKKVDNSGHFVAKQFICDEFNGSGNFKGYNVSLNNFTNDGAVKFEENSVVNGKVYIKGSLFTSKSTFKKAIQVEANKIHITNLSETKDIVIKKSSFSFFNKKQVFIDNSTVNGDILFEDGNGSVVIRNNGFLNGKIYGGVLKKF